MPKCLQVRKNAKAKGLPVKNFVFSSENTVIFLLVGNCYFII